MIDLFRETTFGRFVRLFSRGKYLGYTEESNPAILEQYKLADSKSSSTSFDVDGEQSHEKDGKVSDGQGEGSPTPLADKEKGADYLLVNWLPNDPHNPRNWSLPKKVFVTFQICFLTTSVYIGSAIYTAGLEGVSAQFHISNTKALLGLTLFVIGYALGPMIWVCCCYIPPLSID